MNTKERENLQVGDFVEVYHSIENWDYAIVDSYSRPSNTAELYILDSKVGIANPRTCIIDTENKWARIGFARIEKEWLKRLAFKPESAENAYGKTANKWIKNDAEKTWALQHCPGGGWKLTLNEKCYDTYLPMRHYDNIGWIWQIQRCLNNPDIMQARE